MESCTKRASDRSILDSLLEFWVEWQIVILVVITMCLQVSLVVAGFFRKHTSNPALHAWVWVTFVTLDAFAAFALGLMLASGCGNVFSLYAPILLFHLGAADAINAYAPTDNDLWHRYGFRMLLEVVAAAYIVSRSTDCPNFTTSGALLFIVGAFRYGERIFALRSGSQAQILASARPIYKYMAMDFQRKGGSLLVSGEDDWYQFYNKLSEEEARAKLSNTMVTFQDVKECQSLRKLLGHDVVEHVCLAYALFKVFRRRLTNLRIHQRNDDYLTARKILLSLNCNQIRKVIDLELSFIFDGVFSKAAAGKLYQGLGVLSRFLSAVLLFTAAMELIRLDKTHLQCSDASKFPLKLGLAHMLVVIALIIECLQIRKIVRSNWLRVWLACNYITEGRLAGIAGSSRNHVPSRACHKNLKMGHIITDNTSDQHQVGRRRLHLFNQTAISCAFRFVGKPKRTHWNFKLGQLSILVDSLNLVRWHHLIQFEINKLCEVQTLQLEITNIFTDVSMEKLQDHLINKMVARYEVLDGFKDLGHLRNEILKNVQNVPFDKDAGLEDVILQCHLLTCVFELHLLHSSDYGELASDMDVIVSIGLSRYCMHLMLKKPKLMPEDPDVAKVLYINVKQSLKSWFLKNADKPKCEAFLHDNGSDIEHGDNVLQFALSLHQKMSEQEKYGKWQLLAKVWLDILMFIVYSSEDANPHTEQMAKGGELLTHFWVLIGHFGPGQRSSMDLRLV